MYKQVKTRSNNNNITWNMSCVATRVCIQTNRRMHIDRLDGTTFHRCTRDGQCGNGRSKHCHVGKCSPAQPMHCAQFIPHRVTCMVCFYITCRVFCIMRHATCRWSMPCVSCIIRILLYLHRVHRMRGLCPNKRYVFK
jgi:hypothetical protein